MLRLASVFIDIAFHRKGPDALPASGFLFGLVFAAYLTVSLLALQINWPLGQAVGPLVLDVCFCLAFFWLVLQMMQREARYLQTVIALLGAETFLSLLAIPFLVLRSAADETDVSQAPTIMLLTILFLWSIDIGGFVLSRALEQAYIVGVTIMVGYVISSFMLGEFLFPSLD